MPLSREGRKNPRPAAKLTTMITTTPRAQAASPSTKPDAPAVYADGVSFLYGTRRALDNLSLEIQAGELFAVLGPNGGGKTTLFRLLSTLVPPQRGSLAVFGHELAREASAVRRLIGVVFQAPSLDRKLTVAENIRLQAALYGLAGRDLSRRLDELLDQFSLRDRAHELTERLSGGLRRRVELAKGMVHRPEVLLLDEPSAGLDPAARSDFWQYLQRQRSEHGTTIVLTTHYLDEADGADRIAILNEGRLVALGPPEELRSQVGGDSITIETGEPTRLAAAIRDSLGLEARIIDDAVRLEVPNGHIWIARIVEAFPGRVTAIRLGKPTLEDLFIARTGHRFWRERRRDA
jgi:ABC-2 type transport system ATP-binding protein